MVQALKTASDCSSCPVLLACADTMSPAQDSPLIKPVSSCKLSHSELCEALCAGPKVPGTPAAGRQRAAPGRLALPQAFAPHAQAQAPHAEDPLPAQVKVHPAVVHGTSLRPRKFSLSSEQGCRTCSAEVLKTATPTGPSPFGQPYFAHSARLRSVGLQAHLCQQGGQISGWM